jgi:hypothetical protein
MKYSNRRSAGLFGVVLLALLVGLGCALTRQVRNVQESGFLGDYSQLKPGESGEAQLLYVASNANFSAYNAIVIDSVAIWQAEGSATISEADGKRMAAELYQALHSELSKDYRIVERPGPGVLRIRAALTEAKAAKVVPATVTTILPPPRLITTVAGVAADVQTLVGRARIEGEITDSLTGRRLMAAVDARAGGKTLRGGFGKWSDVRNSFDFWAQRLRTRLADLRAG